MLIACGRVSCEHLKATVLPDHSFKKAANLGSAGVVLPHLRMVLARALASGIRNKGVRPSSQNHLGCGLGAAMVQGGVAINVCRVDVMGVVVAQPWVNAQGVTPSTSILSRAANSASGIPNGQSSCCIPAMLAASPFKNR